MKLMLATLFPTVIALGFYTAEKKTGFAKLSYPLRQAMIGIAFGLAAIAATEFGIPVKGAVLNVRTAAPITAGLLFGAPAGILAGIIGGVERWFSVYWSGGMYTRLACTLATIAAGFFGASMRRQMFDDKKPSWVAGFSIGLTMEVLHMLLVFVTNLSDIHTAFYVVQKCAPLMILLNSAASGLSLFAVGLMGKERKRPQKEQQPITQIFRSGLMVCVILAFAVTCIFTLILQNQLAIENENTAEALFARDLSVYITAFMEILVFAVLFINVYFLTKKVVVDNIHKVNASLAKITGGNLNEQVNVRTNEEFASLTDDINQTVDTLKFYIAEAEARIDKELEFARQIQLSALPSVFPPYPGRKDFDLYALMDTAKEVGGDFYDFYLLGNDRLGFLIADVSGKGIPAAMFMMTAKTVIKGLAESGLEVNEIFTQANRKLCEENETGMFVTAWIGILDLRTGLLSFANAGHNPPLVRRKDGTFAYLKMKANLTLAAMSRIQYQKQELLLVPGDEIFLYTDGVTEAKNRSGDMFQEKRLLETLNRNPGEGVEKRCRNLLREVELFAEDAEQFDDITMLSVKLKHLQTFDRIVVCPDLESTEAVWGFVDSKLKGAQVSGKLANKVKICTDEIFSNILRYSQAKKAELFCRIEDQVLTLVFRDDGIPYNPTKAEEPDVTLPASERKPGGLGIFMVKKSATSMKYRYVDNQNVLTLTFAL